MSSRIEKGGARFKPSIVPRKSTARATPASVPATTASQQTSAQSQKQTPNTSTAPPPSPSLVAVGTDRQSRPPSVRSKASAAADTAATSTSQSYAFNVAPSIISQPGTATTARTSITAVQPSSSSIKPKPIFRKPSISKPRPGSRNSLTPAPHHAQPTASTSASATQPVHAGSGADVPMADDESVPLHVRVPPSIGASSGARNSDASSSHVDAERVPIQTDVSIDKASQPDPVQVPLRLTRSKGASTAPSDTTAVVKQSASQEEATPASRPQRRAGTSSTAPPAPLVERNVNASSTQSSRKGKGREVLVTDQQADSLEIPHTLKSSPQTTQANAPETETEKAARIAQRRMEAAARLHKRRLKRKELSTGKPKRPLSAYLLFVNSVRPQRQAQNPNAPLTELTAEMAAEWRQLAPAQRTKWETEASLLRQQYDSALETWKLAHPQGVTLGPEDESDMETTSELGDDGERIRRKKRRTTCSRKPHTVSDDEEGYRKQVFHEGEQLTASRIDPSNVTMADISAADFKKGRAGPRTFEAERVYTRLVHDRRAAAKSAALGEHVLGEKMLHASPSPAPAANIIRTANGMPIATGQQESLEGEEEIVADQTGDDNDDDDGETDADGTTDGEGTSNSRRARNKREASVAATEVSFRENRFAVQTRIVDGKIVLDETSLFANYGNGEDDRDNMEVVDEREGDRFVNASTYSRKLGRNRKWSADETAKFYHCLQQWGTDFEMIARLFPGRDRVMIKKKFNVEEKSNGKLIDEALRSSMPVNLEAYAQAIGVDLSGPPPEIRADLQDIESLTAAAAASVDATVKKREGTAPASGRKGELSDAEQDDDDDGYGYEEVVEIDDNGNEHVIRRRLGKKQSRKPGKKRRNSTRKNSVSTHAPSESAHAPASRAAINADASVTVDAAQVDSSTNGQPETRSGGPPSIGSRKSTRATRNRAASINSSKHAPRDRAQVEEIVGQL
ncbi:uncharacterized protein UMAG_00808 [Mycosarcoma maydis]|uniref:HMG box domain-containing protein n=1 Tax=Mycosarcoma maydis TaxID=5270 RepID=A0A0D1EB25_MYCMD|nr:uncharacterized protein UMAG_00808 [Ustilago maydis 521]KIS72406.1 hypothetical protein UMAG_00808 [Ustilago maydis 521]|eukprot:XP_011386576.1 hypothetical protein UMAG_00808 [Ustilago maydis 521]